jgi:hypothetical protein
MQGMVVLADQHGTLIHTMGHVDFLGRQTRWRSLWRVLAREGLGHQRHWHGTGRNEWVASRRRAF